MRCDEVEVFVSAMYDGEAVPQEAAEHLAHCAACQELFQSFVETGAELRRFGTLQSAEPVLERTWVQRERTLTRFWKKGLQTTRIPRIAFVSLLLLLLAVGSRLALVEVHAHEDGPVLLLKITLNDRRGSSVCPFSVVDQRLRQCGGDVDADGGHINYSIHFLRKDGDRALLSVRSRFEQKAVSPGEPQEGTMPETQLWVSGGESTDILLGGVTEAKLTAQWTDHIPVMAESESESLDPSVNELRLTSPLLLKNNQVVGDRQGSIVFATGRNMGVWMYIPGEGRIMMSLIPFAGAVSGKLETSRISFMSDGHPYVVLTGAPIARGETIWVKLDPAYKGKAVLGSASVSSF